MNSPELKNLVHLDICNPTPITPVVETDTGSKGRNSGYTDE